jgi:hypothetical protein
MKNDGAHRIAGIERLSFIGHKCVEMNCRFIKNAGQVDFSATRKRWFGVYGHMTGTLNSTGFSTAAQV